jgi:hypothetical protein
MTSTESPPAGGRRFRAAALPLLALAVLAVAVAVFAIARARPQPVKVLNQPTEARKVKPLSDRPDPRFAPLPIEREKHGK